VLVIKITCNIAVTAVISGQQLISTATMQVTMAQQDAMLLYRGIDYVVSLLPEQHTRDRRKSDLRALAGMARGCTKVPFQL
jgi:hypothetical protein